MARGGIAQKLPVGKAVKRLPIGRRKKGIAKVLSNLPLPKSLPGGKATGTAGGLLLGAGAAVAANQAVNRMGKRNAAREDEDAKTRRADDESADQADLEEEDEEYEDEPRAEDDDADEGEQKPGFFSRLFKRDGKKGGGGGGKKQKVTNIVEEIDIGAPRRVVYDQFTQFQEFPGFMKKVVSVDQAADEKLNWKAKIFWSNRTWEATIVEQVPDDHVTWRSKAPKGHVDGTVSFHSLAPNLTRVLVILEYHPQGLFERTGNLWRAQGRRVRLELKHFRRHVMTQTILRADELEGWRGEIRDSEVVKTHEDAIAEEEDKKSGRDEEYDEYEEKPAEEYEEAR
ncbi:SRPBCC family protein [Actinomadura macrotermitis]|uniref:Coenzyme Q-binding protein COQ10 START domain-containing protein n=1 Tax=Actinomadura macrotermitis TaxID=2585200 RepID=A0A7K0C0B2_9ACTN|nr:SRPBCC family protein [Actinomadura macrotermitis]MQY06879.1 hypothetical protein [Actinomadura macrotermitis]